MRYSKTFIPTLRDDPADAEITSHKLMVRAGLLRKAASGLYTWMPIGLRVLRKVENIVREEMDNAGCLELLMPALQPAELWKQSDRWFAYGEEMMRLVDRHQREFCLGPTHEELITSIAKEIHSYKDLPKCFYQIQAKYRDEIRPRFGVMRSREFIMKDAYSFHTTQESLDETYQLIQKAYARIVERCGLSYRVVKAAGGLIGGAVSEEFMVLADAGEDVVVHCENCGYAANLETASSKWHASGENEAREARKKVHTPNKSSINDLAQFLDIPKTSVVKTLIYKAGDSTVAALVPGSKEINPHKLASALGVGEVSLFSKEDFEKRPDIIQGFVGPIGLMNAKIVADNSLRSLSNFVVGANEVDHHFVNVNTESDFSADVWADLVFAEEGEACIDCDHGQLEGVRGIEVGHIFQLGTKYSSKMDAKYVDDAGREQPFIMGCYGIGVSRMVAAAIEQRNDERGIIWPKAIAPFDIHLMNLTKDEAGLKVADKIYNQLLDKNEVLYDDRLLSPGIKFTDADLLGLPVQIIVGKKFAEKKMVEIKIRETQKRYDVEVDKLSDWLKALDEN